jgi:hypothetical protein
MGIDADARQWHGSCSNAGVVGYKVQAAMAAVIEEGREHRNGGRVHAHGGLELWLCGQLFQFGGRLFVDRRIWLKLDEVRNNNAQMASYKEKLAASVHWGAKYYLKG